MEGGRFPSTDLIVNPDRGLQIPLSPSSGSSVIAGQEHDMRATSGNYGPDLTSPTHAAHVTQLANEDGVNPYTALPLDTGNVHPNTRNPAETAAAAGLGGAALGAAGSELYYHQDNNTALSANSRELEAIAAVEASSIAAPDTNEMQAVAESSIISAPDALSPTISDSNAMSGGRSPGQPPVPLDTRPETTTQQSAFSISQLHVPGEYPKSK